MIRKPMRFLPSDVQTDWSASLHQAPPTKIGAYHVVETWGDDNLSGVRRLTSGYENQRVRVQVLDENEQPVRGVEVAFHFSTCQDRFILTGDFLWTPPVPHRAFRVRTDGEGVAEQIQFDMVKAGQAGGITVYVLDPKRSSDFVQGLGMLADHTGIEITFQRQDVNAVPLDERLARLEKIVVDLEAEMSEISSRLLRLESKK